MKPSTGSAQAAVLLVCAGCLAGCWTASDPAAPCLWHSKFQVASSSMAPLFRGPVLSVHCQVCLHAYAVAADTVNPRLSCRCFACGGAAALGTRLMPGQIVSVRPVPDSASLKRFDCVVFCNSQPPLAPQLKRIWGLPGERIRFQNGELWIDGRLYQKSLQELLRVATPVVRFSAAIEIAADSQFEWQYQRPARVSIENNPPDSWLVASDILDDYEGNQGVSRSLHTVDDYLVSCELVNPLTDDLDVQLTYQGHPLAVRFHPHHEVAGANARDDGRVHVACGRQLIVAICDGRLLIKTDLSSVILPIRQRLMPVRPTPQLSIVTHAAGVSLRRLEIWRDQYLIRNDRDSLPADFGRVPPGSLFVLGDNLAVSIDSRHELGFVQKHDVLGVVDD